MGNDGEPFADFGEEPDFAVEPLLTPEQLEALDARLASAGIGFGPSVIDFAAEMHAELVGDNAGFAAPATDLLSGVEAERMVAMPAAPAPQASADTRPPRRGIKRPLADDPVAAHDETALISIASAADADHDLSETLQDTQTSDKPFKCLHCDYRSAQNSNLKKHIRTRSGDKPFQCQHCNYRAIQSSDLKRHALTPAISLLNAHAATTEPYKAAT
jgi:transcription elongation factor Elf1